MSKDTSRHWYVHINDEQIMWSIPDTYILATIKLCHRLYVWISNVVIVPSFHCCFLGILLLVIFSLLLYNSLASPFLHSRLRCFSETSFPKFVCSRNFLIISMFLFHVVWLLRKTYRKEEEIAWNYYIFAMGLLFLCSCFLLHYFSFSLFNAVVWLVRKIFPKRRGTTSGSSYFHCYVWHSCLSLSFTCTCTYVNLINFRQPIYISLFFFSIYL
jgi:hypothetical protein